MEGQRSRVDAGRVIGETFTVYGASFAVLLGGAALTVGIAGVVGGALSETESIGLSALGALLTFIAQALYIGYVIELVKDRRSGQPERGVMDLLRPVLPFVGALTANTILAALGIMLGFIALIVPGLILLTIWAVVSPVIVVEGKGAVEAFGRSRELVRGDGWSVFAALLIAFLIGLAIAVAATVLTLPIDDGGQAISFAIAGVLSAPITGLVASILYFDLAEGEPASPPPA